jgi:hypothetical protein
VVDFYHVTAQRPQVVHPKSGPNHDFQSRAKLPSSLVVPFAAFPRAGFIPVHPHRPHPQLNALESGNPPSTRSEANLPVRPAPKLSSRFTGKLTRSCQNMSKVCSPSVMILRMPRMTTRTCLHLLLPSVAASNASEWRPLFPPSLAPNARRRGNHFPSSR